MTPEEARWVRVLMLDPAYPFREILERTIARLVRCMTPRRDPFASKRVATQERRR